MSVNKYQPHVLVLPEDDANRELATGFVLGVIQDRRIQILPEVGGWLNVCSKFVTQHIKGMRQYQHRHLIMLLDFDNQSDRSTKVMDKVPEDLRSRVFLLGVQSEPEALRRAGFGSFEDIGRTLAAECREGRRDVWAHNLLSRNANEISRLEKVVCNFLF